MSFFEVPQSSSGERSVEELAEHVGGIVIGDPSGKILTVCSLDEPVTGGLAFAREHRRGPLESLLNGKDLGAVLVSKGLEDARCAVPLICVSNPLVAFRELIPLLVVRPTFAPGVHPTAVIEPGVVLGSNVSVGAFSYIGTGSIIEDEVKVYPHVVIYPNVRIGRGALIHSGAILREDVELGAGSIVQNGVVIGADGFGYVLDEGGTLQGIPQIGGVSIGSNVEIGASTCIDRATLGATRIGAGTKIDNLVQIGHNCQIGKQAILCGQVGIAGSCQIGDGVVLGGQTGVADHVKIPAGTRIAAKSGVISSILTRGDYAGFPAQPVGAWRRQLAALRNLPQLVRSLRPGRQSSRVDSEGGTTAGLPHSTCPCVGADPNKED